MCTYGQEQHCPLELSRLETFSICPILEGSHQPHMTTEHLSCHRCNRGAGFFI